MSSFLSENFIKIVSLVIAVIAMMGSIMQFVTFQLEIKEYQADRHAMLFAQSLIGFLSVKDSEGKTKGVISADDLNAVAASGLNYAFPEVPKYYILVDAADGGRWEIKKLGETVTQDELKDKYNRYHYPIAVRYTDGKVVPARANVYVYPTVKGR